MANLLPPFARKKLVREYWLRVGTVVFLMLALAMAAVGVMMVPTYVHLNNNLNAMQSFIQGAEEEQARTQEAQAAVQSTNRLVRLLDDSRERVSFSYYHDQLEQLAGTSVSIRQFQIMQREGSVEDLRIEAVATTRQALIDFLDTLQTHEEFGQVDVPIASLAQSENITFNVQIPVHQHDDAL